MRVCTIRMAYYYASACFSGLLAVSGPEDKCTLSLVKFLTAADTEADELQCLPGQPVLVTFVWS